MRNPLRISPDKTASLFVDMQEEHRHDPRYLVEGYDRVLGNAAALQAAARTRGIEVMHAAYIIDPAEKTPFNPLMQDGTPAFSAKGDPLTEISAEVAPLHGELVIVKAQPSCFGPSELGSRLADSGVEWLLICGVWTEACIDATVKDAVRAGLRVLLVKDACGSGTQAMHEIGILNLANRLYGGAVVDTESAIRLLAGAEVEVWMVEGSVPLQYSYETAPQLYADL